MRPWLLSKKSSTDARPIGLRSPAPLKITSCIDSPRSADAFDSPSTHRTASMTFDLPQPFGPTMPTSCPGVAIDVGSTNDLKPESLICVRRKGVFERKRTAKAPAFRYEGRAAKKSRNYSGTTGLRRGSFRSNLAACDRLDVVDHGLPRRAYRIVELGIDVIAPARRDLERHRLLGAAELVVHGRLHDDPIGAGRHAVRRHAADRFVPDRDEDGRRAIGIDPRIARSGKLAPCRSPRLATGNEHRDGGDAPRFEAHATSRYVNARSACSTAARACP